MLHGSQMRHPEEARVCKRPVSSVRLLLRFIGAAGCCLAVGLAALACAPAPAATTSCELSSEPTAWVDVSVSAPDNGNNPVTIALRLSDGFSDLELSNQFFIDGGSLIHVQFDGPTLSSSSRAIITAQPDDVAREMRLHTGVTCNGDPVPLEVIITRPALAVRVAASK